MDTTDMPAIRYDYVDFTQLEKMNKDNAFVDVLAVIHTVDDLTTIMTKRDSRELSKREITLMDQAQIAVKCTIWGKNAEEWSHQVGDVIAIKKAKLSDFGGTLWYGLECINWGGVGACFVVHACMIVRYMHAWGDPFSHALLCAPVCACIPLPVHMKVAPCPCRVPRRLRSIPIVRKCTSSEDGTKARARMPRCRA